MRIRSIKPEFWRSDDTAALTDWHTRLVFLGLWSYVDDNGVGRDNPALIMSDLFPQEPDPRETLARIHRALDELSHRKLIVRYEAENKQYLFITGWHHQKIDRPSAPRYPLPVTSDYDESDEGSRVLDEGSLRARKDQGSGNREQGSRGTGTKGAGNPPPDREPAADPWLFTEFWNHYPWQAGQPMARKAWDVAVRKHNPDLIVAAAKAYAADPNREEGFTKKPANWLNEESWNDGPLPSRAPTPMPKRSYTDQRVQEGRALTERLLAQEASNDNRQIGA